MKYMPHIPGGSRGQLSSAALATAQTTASNLNPNDTAWSILYGALTQSLGLNPQTFQLIYPMTSWNWPPNNLGYTNSAQYDFCATIPQWSAVGGYVSSGATFDNAYQQLLNCVVLYSTNPALQQQILKAQNNVTQISQQLQTASAQALNTYNQSVTNNNPTYTAWLGSPAGAGYAAQINSLTLQLTQAQNVVTQLANEQTTPNIAN